jgi:hypothetical protein
MPSFLTWTVLHFTKHTISGGSSNRFLRAFDEEYEDEDGVKGGILKKGFLLGCDIPCMVKFDCCPCLDRLIKELTEAFAVHYDKPLPHGDFEALKDMQSNNAPPSYNSSFKYQQWLDDLATPSWLVDTFHCHLNVDPWSPSNKA